MPNILAGSMDKFQSTLETVITNTSILNLPYTKTELLKYLGRFEFLIPSEIKKAEIRDWLKEHFLCKNKCS